jgi:hypothetical protein
MIQRLMTCREPERDDERTAKRLVQLCWPEVQVCLHDDGSRPGMFDLWLCWPNQHVEAMEVTTETAPDLRQLGNRLDVQGAVIATKSSRDWFVYLEVGTTDVRNVRAKIDRLLGLVEEAGITRFGRPEEHSSVAVARVRRQLGVNYAFSREAAGEKPRIQLILPMHGWFIRPEVVNEAVERHAQLNAEKLSRAGHKERHLFMLIEPISKEVWSALVERQPPGTPPQLPDAITTAWAAGYRADGSPVIWKVRRTGRWEVLL